MATITLSHKLKQWYQDDTEIPNWLSSIFTLYQRWWAAFETQSRLYLVNALDTTKSDLGRLQALLYDEYKKQHDLFVAELSEKISLKDILIVGHTEFRHLEFELSCSEKNIYVVYELATDNPMRSRVALDSVYVL